MHIELTDYLRCTRDHADTWLVLTSLESSNRVIQEGSLDCHLCGAHYPIRNGIIHFDTDAPVSNGVTVHHAPADTTRNDSTGTNTGSFADASKDVLADPWRLAALLNLDTPGKAVLLIGTDIATAAALGAVANSPRIIVASAAGFSDAMQYGGNLRLAPISYTAGGAVPVAPTSINAIAILSGAMPPNAVSTLVGGARLVAPAAMSLPEEVSELARDEHQWVAQREALPSRVIVLKRQPSS